MTTGDDTSDGGDGDDRGATHERNDHTGGEEPQQARKGKGTGEGEATTEQALLPNAQKRKEMIARFRELDESRRKQATGRVVRKAAPAEESEGGEPAEGAEGEESPADLDEERRELQERAAKAKEEEASEDEPETRAKTKETPAGGKGQDKAKGQDKTKAKAAAARSEEADDEDAQHYTINVYGRDEKVSLRDLKRLAQMQRAEDDKRDARKKELDESAKLVADAIEAAKALRSSPENPPGKTAKAGTATDASDPENPPAQDAKSDTRRPSRDKLRAIVERIQVGDTDEGVDAAGELFDLLDEAAKGKPTPAAPENIDQRVNTAITKQRVESENRAALERFADTYPEIAKDELLGQAGMSALGLEIEKDLRRIGAEIGIEAKAIDALKGNTQALVAAHTQLRMAGHKVATPDELLAETGKVMSERFGIRPREGAEAPGKGNGRASNGSQQQTRSAREGAPASQSDGDRAGQERVERKRQLTPQPRAAGVRAQVPQGQKPMTSRQILERARKQRGYAPSM